MLLPISARSYRSHTAHHAFINKVNAPETVADPNLALSRLVENRVRGEVAQQLSPTDYRVLRWEQRERKDKLTGKIEVREQLTYRRGYGRSVRWRRCHPRRRRRRAVPWLG
jgi:hypothetical protein